VPHYYSLKINLSYRLFQKKWLGHLIVGRLFLDAKP